MRTYVEAHLAKKGLIQMEMSMTPIEDKNIKDSRPSGKSSCSSSMNMLVNCFLFVDARRIAGLMFRRMTGYIKEHGMFKAQVPEKGLKLSYVPHI